MNREIKFRAWDKKNKHMWLSDDIGTMGGRIMFNYKIPCEEKDLIIMQFTGLKDKNGKEICEGDIVEYNGKDKGWSTILYKGKYKVEVDIINGIRLVGFYNQEYIKLKGFFNKFEVIGNIYENPELLK